MRFAFLIQFYVVILAVLASGLCAKDKAKDDQFLIRVGCAVCACAAVISLVVFFLVYVECLCGKSTNDKKLKNKGNRLICLDKEEVLLRFPFNINDPAFITYGAFSKNLYFSSTKWYLNAEHKLDASNSLRLSFHCSNFVANISFKGSLTISLLGTITDILRTENYCFTKENDSKDMLDFVSWNELIDPANGFVDKMGNAVIEVKFTVNAFADTGPCAIEICFFFKQDALLLINGRRVGVNKALLSAASSYFNDLFNVNFRAGNQYQIVIEDVGLAEFTYLLDAIYDAEDDASYARITVTNAEALLHLADRFNVQIVMKQCEVFLQYAGMEMERKLVFAQNYRLTTLQDFCFEHYSTLAEYRLLRSTDQFKLLTGETKIKLLEPISDNF